MKIIVDKDIPFIRGVFEPCAEVIYLAGIDITPSTVRDADALVIRTRTHCDENLLAGSRVSFITSATVGYDHIDAECCRSKGIEWTNAPGCNSGAVQQYLVCALLNFAQEFCEDLRGKTLGIVGAGNVGSKVEIAARALGMNVLLNDPPLAETNGAARFVDLNTLLQNSDYLSLHVPLTTHGVHSTVNMANSDFFDGMKPRSVFINTSRGEVVDENALKVALHNGKLRAAALDVWRSEPVIDLELVKTAAVSTFHIAGYSVQGKMNASAMAINSVIKHFNLPLDLYPRNIENIKSIEININTSGKSPQSIIVEAMNASYDLVRDSVALKNAPQNFEHLRNSYNYRHEPAAFALKLIGACDDDIARTLSGLGFNLM